MPNSQKGGHGYEEIPDELQSVIGQYLRQYTIRDDPIVDEYNGGAGWCYRSDLYGSCQLREWFCQDNYIHITGFCHC